MHRSVVLNSSTGLAVYSEPFPENLITTVSYNAAPILKDPMGVTLSLGIWPRVTPTVVACEHSDSDDPTG
ncbi:Uncharacterized protein HZ326_18282 [Fusarium oxysporum f. sp. albedinis]|nr:Uncharacterized protein HZ326_18282 [Fusarium oxysporum f. sp. albedinis]